MGPDIVDSMPAITVSIDMIVESIKRLKINSAAGPDRLPSIILKKFPHEFAIPLQKIFQKSLNLGVLPSQWKVAHVVPVFKNKGKRSDPSNYRPVSLTCISCKLLERIIKNKMWKFARENKLISDHQHGFVSKRSTQTQLLECGNYWTYWVGNKEGVDVVYLDISKAFDTVSHPKLLYKLKKMGFRGALFKWLENFLCGRTQKVKINNIFSSSSNVKSGVPQGSVLGPLLFILYLNDIISCIGDCFIKIFADDCKLYLCIRKFDKYLSLLHAIINVFSWADLNQLEIALHKCFILHLGSLNPKLPYAVKVPYAPLPEVNSIEDLGVIVSSDMKFSDHCLAISKKSFSAY